MTVVCPNCGFKHAEESFAAELQDLIFVLPLKEKDALVRLIKARGAKVSCDAMMAYLYGNDLDGGPEGGLTTMYSHISKLRSKIEGFGWTITNKRFEGYRLVKVKR